MEAWEPMRVALELEPCCGELSGIGYYTYELAKRMVSDGQLEFAGNVYDFLGKEGSAAKLIDLPMQIRSCRCFPYWLYHRIWKSVPVTYGMMFPKADVTHFFNYIVPPRIKGRVLTTIHDLTYVRYPETMNERGLAFLRSDMKRSVDRCDRIIANSEFVKKEIMTFFGLDADLIRVISPDAQIAQTTLTLDDLKAKWNLDAGYILFIGNIEPRKNLIRLIKAYRKLRNEAGIRQKLVLAGGNGWKSEDIRAEALKTEGCVMTGYVSADEKALLYKYAGVLAYISIYEGFGMPVLEAMNYDVPVVCSNAASLPEVAGNAARFVFPEDVASISEGLYDVLTDEALRKKMRLLGRENARRYSWDISAEKLKSVYLEFA